MSSFPPSLRTMDHSILRSVGWDSPPHVLHSRWHMWYHNTIQKDYSKSSFVDLFPKPIECLEELILLFNSWDEALPEADKGMFYLMREMKSGPIYPCREDPHNQNGGYWTCKIDTENAAEVWKKLCFLMVNENVVEEWQKINGVSITPKHGFCLVKIWNRLDDECDTSQLKKYMSNFLDLDKVMYFNNKIKIAIDSKRQTNRPRHSTESKRSFFRTERKKSSNTPIQRPMVFQQKPNIPFGGGWRDLLRQQTSVVPTEISSNQIYRPPGISHR